MHEALRCITEMRFTTSERAPLVVQKLYPVLLNEMNSVPLKGTIPLLFTMGQDIEIVALGDDDPRGRFRVHTLRYLYAFSTLEETELVVFHWHPNESGTGSVTFPHLHIGTSLISENPPLRPKDLHKAHIPTGRVSFEAVVRFAITELGVTPLRANWEAILQQSEDRFIAHKTW
jgi:hypothetical protein